MTKDAHVNAAGAWNDGWAWTAKMSEIDVKVIYENLQTNPTLSYVSIGGTCCNLDENPMPEVLVKLTTMALADIQEKIQERKNIEQNLLRCRLNKIAEDPRLVGK